jgi:hypothetical protein
LAAHVDPIDGVKGDHRPGMDASGRGGEKGKGVVSPRMARAKLEEQLGKLDISDAEATPLVIDDREEESMKKW